MAVSKLIVTSGTSKITGQFFPSAPGGLVSSLILKYHMNFQIEFGIPRKRTLTRLQIKIATKDREQFSQQE
ncbi:hypothetical protein T4B_10051 [Trichinella pseudospiralis]|uniref:Uncharacterized protein n=1 Tax=Trichinella pseudospiralis TaxID=6337 RepID=A0A0V1I3R8_TRIPS|nr:hypothetical protein T4B_10051 [Trichinella pseudospiralis]